MPRSRFHSHFILLLPISLLASELAHAQTTSQERVQNFRHSRSSSGFLLGGSTSLGGNRELGPSAALYGELSSWKLDVLSFHAGGEFAYAFHLGRTATRDPYDESRFYFLSRLVARYDSEILLVRWFYAGVKGGWVHSERNRATAGALGIPGSENAFAAGPCLGMDAPITPNVSLSTEFTMLFAVGDSADAVLQGGLGAKIWF